GVVYDWCMMGFVLFALHRLADQFIALGPIGSYVGLDQESIEDVILGVAGIGLCCAEGDQVYPVVGIGTSRYLVHADAGLQAPVPSAAISIPLEGMQIHL